MPNKIRELEMELAHCAGGDLTWLEMSGVRLPRVRLADPHSSDRITIGLFAGIHGDEPAGPEALLQLVREMQKAPSLLEDYELLLYPMCNPTGLAAGTRESAQGKDLNREFWRNSPEPEVRLLEEELKRNRFQGLIQLHTDDTSEGVYGFVRGATLTENLLRPALLESGKILPRNVNALIDGFAARDGIIYSAYEGILAAPREIEPVPFEIILETPGSAEVRLQVEALVSAIKTILGEYRKLISFAQNI